MIHQAASLIKFLRVSTNKHGVHSPFVYGLVTKCFNDKTKFPGYAVMRSHKRTLKLDKALIQVNDQGQGSRVFKGPNRKISTLSRKVGMKKKRQKLLFRLGRYLECETILEFGTSLGLGTVALALSNEFATVDTVEACENTAETAQKYFRKFGMKNIHIHRESFQNFLINNPNKKYDLIFIDGDHNGERTFQYFEKLLNNVHNNSVIIFDDIYWSKDMTEAWKKIITHEKVQVSIDTFQWGMVFFRKEQAKEHFVIRV